MTPRQKLLLKAIIGEFIDTANAVGSLNIPKKYKINASPATIRNEMAKLVRLGYLEKPHSSSGRLPTTEGLRYYLTEMLDEIEEMEYRKQAEIKERFHQKRFDKHELIVDAVESLSEITNNAAIALVDKNVFYAGLSHILAHKEFRDFDKLKVVLDVIDNYSALNTLFSKNVERKKIKVLIGEETGFDEFGKYAVVFTPIELYGRKKGYLSIIGPNRMKYRLVIPALRTVAESIEMVVHGW
ncbi:MAG TPA: hypothetical protein VGA67_00005 [Candidatus Dojkabacteria bacterium]|jgi:heat-inducible transcriptional repressor